MATQLVEQYSAHCVTGIFVGFLSGMVLKCIEQQFSKDDDDEVSCDTQQDISSRKIEETKTTKKLPNQKRPHQNGGSFAATQPNIRTTRRRRITTGFVLMWYEYKNTVHHISANVVVSVDSCALLVNTVPHLPSRWYS